jgi:hypothetical protein
MSSHIVAVPRWFLGIRIVQLILAVIVLCLNAYGIYYVTYLAFVYSIAAVRLAVRSHFLKLRY